MTRLQKIQLKQSELREKINGLLGTDDRTAEQDTELRELTDQVQSTEVELRAALAVEPDPQTRTTDTGDPEVRERLELRGRATFGGFILAALQGREPAGAEHEYRQSLGLGAGIPLDLFEADRPAAPARETRASTPAPNTGTGTTVAPVQPFVFSESIAPRLSLDQPQVGSGAYSEITISTALTPMPEGKGDAADGTAAVLTPVTASPRRISARLSLAIEDIALVGTDTFESALRSHASMALSHALDNQIINGDGNSPNINGLINQLTDPNNPGAVADFDSFLAAFADQIDGLWAMRTKDVAVVTNADAYKLSAKAFRDAGQNDRGSIAFADYAMEHTAGWWTNSRMPATAGTIARGIVHRRGRMGLRTACLPTWATLSVDDIYTDSASGQRHFSLHVLVGDKVLLVQPDAYDLVEFKVA